MATETSKVSAFISYCDFSQYDIPEEKLDQFKRWLVATIEKYNADLMEDTLATRSSLNVPEMLDMIDDIVAFKECPLLR